MIGSFTRVALMLALSCCAAAASASVTLFTDKGGFDAAASTTAYDFEAYDDGYFDWWDTLTTGPATFASSDGFISTISPDFIPAYGTTAVSLQYGTVMDIALASSATAFGMDIGSYRGEGQLELWVNGELVADQIAYPWYESTFFGFTSTDGFDTIELRTNGTSETLEMARFYTDAMTPVTNTPEPASWTMMVAGFGAIGFGLRRKRAAVRARG